MKASVFLNRSLWIVVLTAIAVFGVVVTSRTYAAQNPLTPEAGALVDLTGNWVSVVSEDWHWRMLTPPRGDFASLPLNAEGTKVGMAWDPQADVTRGEQCRAFGAAGIMRMPGRLRISWQDDATLKIEADAGRQTRLLHFRAANPPPVERTWQGQSSASWDGTRETGRGIAAAVPRPGQGGALTVVTTNMRSGYLRKNGVPYSEQAVLTEYFDRYRLPNGQEWMVVTSVVEDPLYLSEPYITSTDFKREPDGSKWNPTDCVTPAPLLDKTARPSE